MTNKKVCTAPVAMNYVGEIFGLIQKEGKTPVLYIPGNTGRIGWLEELLFTNARIITGGELTYVFQTLSLGDKHGWRKAVAHGVRPVTPFIGPGVRDLVNEGHADNIHEHLSNVHELFEGLWRPDVAFAHVSSPDDLGRVTLGLNAGLDISAVRNAKFKIAVVNSNMPRFAIGKIKDKETGLEIDYGCAMFLDEFDLVVYQDEILLEHAMKIKPKDVLPSKAVASKIVRFLSSYSEVSELPHTLQLGIGAIPNAFAEMLATLGVSVRGIWSEMFSDGVLQLYKAGLIRNTRGEYLRDRIVVGFVLGSKELYETMHENHDFVVLPQEIVNDPFMIGRNDYMASINTALAVSLLGQVVASMIGKEYYSDVGGQYDFAYGARRSRGGVSIIAFRSSVFLGEGTEEGKIVDVHAEGSHYTISANLPLVVITEQGVADLRGRSDRQRVEAMLEVSCPKWRFSLERKVGLLPAMQGVGVIPPRIVLLKSGEHVTVRPATSNDIPAIRTYLNSQSTSDLASRYMGTVSVSYLTSDKRMNDWYVHSLDFVKHAAFVVELHGAIIGVAHAFKVEGEKEYEVAFSRLSGREGEGIGQHLMCTLVDWAKEAEVEKLHAITYKSNTKMCKLFNSFGFTASPDVEMTAVNYDGLVVDIVSKRLTIQG
ncbi:MAG: GNAT family N-acetyltransferase [Candidatus Paceibacterota bacterium]